MIARRCLCVLTAAAALSAAACGADKPQDPLAAGAALHEAAPPAALLAQIPKPASRTELNAALQRHAPVGHVSAEPQAVVLEVTVTPQGVVRAAKAVAAPTPHGEKVVHLAVLRERQAGASAVGERPILFSTDPHLAQAAERAIREVRFEPALQDGVPVEATTRLMVTFTKARNR